jgi:hypothetical protein
VNNGKIATIVIIRPSGGTFTDGTKAMPAKVRIVVDGVTAEDISTDARVKLIDGNGETVAILPASAFEFVRK